jgi:hypothetical protein
MVLIRGDWSLTVRWGGLILLYEYITMHGPLNVKLFCPCLMVNTGSLSDGEVAGV